MPIHEYECTKCHYKVQQLEPMDLKEWPQCPVDGQQMQRLISVPASPQFKGDGWTPRTYGGGNEKETA